MNIVLVPKWIEPLLQQNHLRYADLTNVEKLRSILSLQDVSFYLYLQDHLRYFLPEKMAAWVSIAPIFASQDISEYITNSTRVTYPLSGSQALNRNILKDVADYLNYCGADLARYSETDGVSAIELEILSEEELTFYVRVKPSTLSANHIGTYSQLLSACSKYKSMEEVAKLNLFKVFETLLSKELLLN